MLCSKYCKSKEERIVHYRKYIIKTTILYLTEYKAGLQINIKRFTMTNTVETFLLMGDNIDIEKKIYLKKAIKQPGKKDIMKVVEEFILYSLKNGLIQTE